MLSTSQLASPLYILRWFLKTKLAWKLSGISLTTSLLATKGYTSFTRYREDSRNFALRLRSYLKPTDTVLDFGCGIGGYAFEVSKFCKVVVGIDINEFYIRLAKKLYAKKASKVKFYWYNGDNIPFNDCSFDMIYVHAVFERIPKTSVEKYLKEFWRILRPNGKLLADFLREEASDSDFVSLLGPDAYIFWSEWELINVLAKSGFRVQNLIKTSEKFIVFAINIKSLNMK